MMINFAIIGRENLDKTVESIKQFKDVCSVTSLKNPESLNYALSKKGDLFVICESGDEFSEDYISSCETVFNENPIVGGIYSNFILKKRKIFLPSFCRQSIVRNKFLYPMNCILRQNLLTKDFFKYGNSVELFRKFSSKYMMYHCHNFFVSKKEFTSNNLDKLEEICEYSDAPW